MREAVVSEQKQFPVLVVDDFAMIVRIIRHHLKRSGFSNVDSASNGLEAIEMIKAKTYALIISDWHMEPMSGFQLLQKLRADPAHAEIPFIMATVESRRQYIVAARDAGATDYVIKPFSGPTLRASVTAALSKRATRGGVFPQSGFVSPEAPARWRTARPLMREAPKEPLIGTPTPPAPVLDETLAR